MTFTKINIVHQTHHFVTQKLSTMQYYSSQLYFGILKKKKNQSLVVLIDNSQDSIKERFLQLASEKCQNLIHYTEMQTIMIMQIFTSLRKAKFLLTTQGICHHMGRMNAPVEQLTSSIKKKTRCRR